MNITPDLIYDLVINLASIVVLFLIVRRLAYKPVKKYLDERKQRLFDEEEKARELTKSAEEAKAKYEQLISNGEEIKLEKIKHAEIEAREKSQAIIDGANERAKEIIETAQKHGEESYQRALENGRDKIMDISLTVAQKLLERNINTDDNKKAVEAFLAELDGERNA